LRKSAFSLNSFPSLWIGLRVFFFYAVFFLTWYFYHPPVPFLFPEPCSLQVGFLIAFSFAEFRQHIADKFKNPPELVSSFFYLPPRPYLFFVSLHPSSSSGPSLPNITNSITLSVSDVVAFQTLVCLILCFLSSLFPMSLWSFLSCSD